MHSTDDLDDGYFGSGSLLSRSIKKHGKDKHHKEILEHLPTREALKLREKELVNEELLGDKRCMNLRLGGEGGWDHVNSIRTPEQQSALGKLARANSPGRKGIKCSDDHRLRISQTLTGRPNWSPGTSGKTFTKTVKAYGEMNSQYGTCWVTLNGASKKIKKELLEEHLLNGYSRGRTIPT
jgi:hypothetical protein